MFCIRRWHFCLIAAVGLEGKQRGGGFKREKKKWDAGYVENAAFSTLKCLKGDAARGHAQLDTNGYAEGKQTARGEKRSFLRCIWGNQK